MSAVEEAAKVLSAATWPDGAHDGFPSNKVARMLAEALAAAGLLPEGETRTEWGVRLSGDVVGRLLSRPVTEEGARRSGRGVSRTVTAYPDRVGPWTEVQP